MHVKRNDLNAKSRMKGDFHVRFRERLRVKFPWSTRQDIVINTITVTHDKPQSGTSNVNIYASDQKLKIRGKEQRKADRERLRIIGDALVAYLDAQNIADLEYWIESDTVIKEAEVKQHYRNIRISWNIH